MPRTSRALIEYVCKHRPLVKLRDAARAVGLSEQAIREAASKRLWDAIRVVGKPPNEYLRPATSTVEEGLRAVESQGLDLDENLADPEEAGDEGSGSRDRARPRATGGAPSPATSTRMKAPRAAASHSPPGRSTGQRGGGGGKGGGGSGG